MSGTLKSIVVGIDQGERTDHALRVGLDLAERFDASLSLVHVVPPPPWVYASIDMAVMAELEQETVAAVRKRLVAHVAKIFKERGKGARAAEVALHLAQGDPAHALVGEARKRDADVVVIGPHEKRGLFDFGRTVRGLLARAPGSVWVQPAAVREIKRILVPVDLSEPSLRALGLACRLAKSYGASVDALHCFHFVPIEGAYPEYAALSATFSLDDLRRASEEAFTKAMGRFNWRGVAHETRFVDGEPVETIRSQRSSFDLIVLSTHGRSGLRGVILGNVAYSVLKDARTPVLATRRS